MSLTEQIITISMCILGTVLTRFLPFVIFSSKKPTPEFIQYLGKMLPGAIFSMLVIYCLRNIMPLQYSYGFPELISIIVIIVVHLWKRQMLLSIATGTVSYMLLVQCVFL